MPPKFKKGGEAHVCR